MIASLTAAQADITRLARDAIVDIAPIAFALFDADALRPHRDGRAS